MAVYRRILVAVDLTEDSTYIAQRARALASALEAELELLHVVEPVPALATASVESVATVVMQTQDQFLQTARRGMAELAAKLGLSDTQWQVVLGNTKHEIVRVAEEQLVDLIVIGRRERHGISMLIDLTEDAVLHRAKCDVLAVRVSSPG
jgi:universal stress protein A